MITLHVKLSTTLRDYIPGYVPAEGLMAKLPAGGTVADMARAVGLPLGEIKIIMVNGRHAALETVLNDRDRVAYFPAVGGG